MVLLSLDRNAAGADGRAAVPAPLFARPWLLLALLVLGTIGFSCRRHVVRRDVDAIAHARRALPILLYPVTVPVIIAGVRGTSALTQTPADEPMATLWIGAAGVFRRRVRDAGAVDVRAVDDGMTALGDTAYRYTDARADSGCDLIARGCVRGALQGGDL